jgi:hypothetical protein
MLQVFQFEQKDILCLGTWDKPEWVANDVQRATGISSPKVCSIKAEGEVYSLFDLYALAVEYSTKDIDIAVKIMELVRATNSLFAHEFPEATPFNIVLGGATGERLYRSTMMYIAWAANVSTSEVSGIHPWFECNVNKLILGAKIVEHRKKGIKDRPDFWLDINGKLCPVEIKKAAFTKKALNQLQRYVDVFDCEHGYAVASSLRVELPKNITFIKYDCTVS